MQLSTKGRYAVMAMVEVARQGSGAPVCLGQIAERLDLSLAYLEQLFMKLRRAGLVKSVRGPGGGYVVGKPASDIPIGEIMSAVAEPFKMTRCEAEDIGCVITRRCSTHHLWEALGSHIDQFLNGATLEDVVSGRYSNPEPKAADILAAILAERRS
jgi:Rrf2 family transcriptional regulator, iron-sulfur cluster assembly transcription factor